MYIIMYIQCAKHFGKWTQFCKFNIHIFLKNVHNFLHLRTQFFNECTQFCIFNVHNFSQNEHNSIYSIYIFSKNMHNFVYSLYKNFQRMYTIIYIQCSKFFKECIRFVHSKCTFFLKNVYNFIHLTCTIFQRQYTILYNQRNQFLNNVHNISKNVQNYLHSRYPFFKECKKICTFKVPIF